MNRNIRHTLLVNTISVCGGQMAVAVEFQTLPGSSAWHATAKHPACDLNYAVQTTAVVPWDGGVDNERRAFCNLGCLVEVVRVHIRNGNMKCDDDSNGRCALKNFVTYGEEVGWQIIGDGEMADPLEKVLIHLIHLS